MSLRDKQLEKGYYTNLSPPPTVEENTESDPENDFHQVSYTEVESVTFSTSKKRKGCLYL